MTDEPLVHGTRTQGEPPAGGRTDHESMRRAAGLPVQGPASSDALAAGGGLEVPGREPDGATAPVIDERPHPAVIIPGAREADTFLAREAGGMGGQFTGMDIPSSSPELMDDRTTAERSREGGDAAAGRK